MARYHVNKSTGAAGVCRALEGRCPFGDEGEHFPTAYEASEHYAHVVHGDTDPETNSFGVFTKAGQVTDEGEIIAKRRAGEIDLSRTIEVVPGPDESFYQADMRIARQLAAGMKYPSADARPASPKPPPQPTYSLYQPSSQPEPDTGPGGYDVPENFDVYNPSVGSRTKLNGERKAYMNAVPKGELHYEGLSYVEAARSRNYVTHLNRMIGDRQLDLNPEQRYYARKLVERVDESGRNMNGTDAQAKLSAAVQQLGGQVRSNRDVQVAVERLTIAMAGYAKQRNGAVNFDFYQRQDPATYVSATGQSATQRPAPTDLAENRPQERGVGAAVRRLFSWARDDDAREAEQARLVSNSRANLARNLPTSQLRGA